MATVRALVVDWLGRGGIAQCAEAWGLELAGHGVEVLVATRAGRELAATPLPTATSSDVGGALRAHARLVRLVVRTIRERQPDCVVFQNYLIPPMEEPAYRAARAVGARVVLTVHDHRHHTFTSGLHAGLAGQIRRADVLFAHTRFVADAVAGRSGRAPVLLPHPVQVGMLRRPAPDGPVLSGSPPMAIHFGVLARRGPKGTDLAVRLATEGVEGWRFAFLGVGAPRVPGADSIDRFLEPGELVDAVRQSAATVLPYRAASQSGAVVLAQALGSVPVATIVGGMAEQIEHGVTGILLAPGSQVDTWRRALLDLDPDHRQGLADRARQAVWAGHREFVATVLEAVGIGAEDRS